VCVALCLLASLIPAATMGKYAKYDRLMQRRHFSIKQQQQLAGIIHIFL